MVGSVAMRGLVLAGAVDDEPTPLERFIADGGVLWLDPADAINGMGGVAEIPDATGNWTPFTQPTGADRPEQVTLGGHPALQGAVGDHLEHASFFHDGPKTMYTVLETMSSVPPGNRFVCFGNGGKRADIYFAGVSHILSLYGTAGLGNATTTAGLSQRMLVRAVFNGVASSLTMYRHGASTVTLAGNVGVSDFAQVTLLGRHTVDSFEGKMGHYIIAPGDYSASDAYLIAHLLSLYGIVPA